VGTGEELPEWLSVAGDLRRDVALSSFLPPGDSRPELIVFSSQVQRVDVVAGTAARLRIAQHLREHPYGTVAIVPPVDAAVAERFLELLHPLPDRVSVTAARPLPARPRFALVPATPIPDSAAAVAAGEYALQACENARISEARSGVIALALMELADNALRHADGLDIAPVVAATVTGRERRVEVAVTDLGRGISEAETPRRVLGLIPGANRGTGFLPELLRLGMRHNLSVSIEVLAGRGRLRWTSQGHATEDRRYVVGTTVVARVNP
jgi:anti-sigma regulatory factor (Ser/Thr protein kinase)